MPSYEVVELRRTPVGPQHAETEQGDTMSQQLRFMVLGPVRAKLGDVDIPLGSPLQRTVLAVLLMRQGSTVDVAELVDALWGDNPPASATNSVRVYVYKLRRLLTQGGDPTLQIESVGSGYLLTLLSGSLDLLDFHQRVAAAEQLRAVGDSTGAIDHLREALTLWHGSALADLTGEWAQSQRSFLDGARLSAIEACLAAKMESGSYAESAVELTALVAAYPLDERFREMLMLSLHRTGRTAAALTVYQEVRDLLVDELGLDPGPALQRTYEHILHANKELMTWAGEEQHGSASAHTNTPPEQGLSDVSGHPSPAPPARLPEPVPTQLPNDLAVFAGREPQLEQLHQMLNGCAEPDPHASRIFVVTGTAGVGKTALAVHWAHQVAPLFPDGQLYVNLRGCDAPGTALSTSTALRALLEGLGVPSDALPTSLEAKMALYRGLLAERRVLLLLDNARSAEDVRPLLAGVPGCLTLVTSRNQLSGLIVRDGAYHVGLDVLSDQEAGALLVKRIGSQRLAAEPGAVREIIERSGGLPLALALVSARVATRSEFPLSAIAEELRDSPTQLDAFSHLDASLDVRSILSWSYRDLSAQAARLFRLLSVHPGPSISLDVAAALADLTLSQTRQLLGELTHAHLVGENTPGRFYLHSLLRGYASEMAHSVDSTDVRRAALHRVLTYYVQTSCRAALLLFPSLPKTTLSDAIGGVSESRAIPDHASATAWFTAEYPVLPLLVQEAVAAGSDTHAWQLAWLIMEFAQERGNWDDQISTLRAALKAARRAQDRRGQAETHRNLARLYAATDRHQDASVHLGAALSLFEDLADLNGQARTHGVLGLVSLRQGNVDLALTSCRNALALYEEQGDRTGLARSLNNVGWILAHLGSPGTALAHCRRALRLSQEVNDQVGEAACWDSLGYVLHDMGRYREALDCYHHALAINREIGDRRNEAETLVHVGDTHRALNDDAAACDAWERALVIQGPAGMPRAEKTRVKLRELRDHVAR
ncbi:AfsR/SARP family transcriptional regulator [Streptomyces sp. NPDC088847]|uniref:AfsR/SARP family transcriptional regulator n=1 Tax=Streptomyces sp. NPDC088847 TaxID=3365909 RepID=UPI00380EC0B2